MIKRNFTPRVNPKLVEIIKKSRPEYTEIPISSPNLPELVQKVIQKEQVTCLKATLTSKIPSYSIEIIHQSTTYNWLSGHVKEFNETYSYIHVIPYGEDNKYIFLCHSPGGPKFIKQHPQLFTSN